MLAPVDGLGWWYGLAVSGRGQCRVAAFGVSGRGQCRVGAFGVSGLLRLADFFITISHCAWRRVISLSKATKKRSKENAFNHATLSVHSVQFLFMGAPKARCSPEPRMCEPLLLANPDTNTLRPVRSRASTLAKETRTALRVSDYSVSSRGLAARSCVRLRMRGYLVCVGYGLTSFSRPYDWRRVGDVVRHAYKFGGRLSADSAGCTLGRFSHWWRSVWVSVFGEGGFHTSFALASTVLLGHL